MNELLLTQGFEERLGEILGHGMKIGIAPFLLKAQKKKKSRYCKRLFIYSLCFILYMISCHFGSILHPNGFLIHHPFPFPLTPRYTKIINHITHIMNNIVLNSFKLDRKLFEGKIKAKCKARRKIITTLSIQV